MSSICKSSSERLLSEISNLFTPYEQDLCKSVYRWPVSMRQKLEVRRKISARHRHILARSGLPYMQVLSLRATLNTTASQYALIMSMAGVDV